MTGCVAVASWPREPFLEQPLRSTGDRQVSVASTVPLPSQYMSIQPRHEEQSQITPILFTNHDSLIHCLIYEGTNT